MSASDGDAGGRARLRVCALGALAWSAAALAAPPWREYAARPDEWYRGAEGVAVAESILSWQARGGGWPKNTDTTKPFSGDARPVSGTFDNGATVGEMRFLARAFRATGDRRLERAFLKGLDHVLEAQYPTGGWPQSYPPGRGYHRHITFNDGTMVNLMELLREVAGSAGCSFVDEPRRRAAKAAFDRGVGCILACQVRVNGRPSVWCAQHDEIDLRPRPGRSYELVSLSGAESAGILRLLMSLDDPAPEVVRAVEGGAAWFAAARIEGVRIVSAEGDRRVVADPDAPPLWARFYEIGTGRPIFCGRDGVKKYSMAEIERERRTGYAWYGDWGRAVADEHARWKAKRAAAEGAPSPAERP